MRTFQKKTKPTINENIKLSEAKGTSKVWHFGKPIRSTEWKEKNNEIKNWNFTFIASSKNLFSPFHLFFWTQDTLIHKIP